MQIYPFLSFESPGLAKHHLQSYDYVSNSYMLVTLPNEYTLVTVAFLLLLDTNLLLQAGITHYSQLHDMTALY